MKALDEGFKSYYRACRSDASSSRNGGAEVAEVRGGRGGDCDGNTGRIWAVSRSKECARCALSNGVGIVVFGSVVQKIWQCLGLIYIGLALKYIY